MCKRKEIVDYYGVEILSLGSRQRDVLADLAFTHWREVGFPFLNFEKEEIKSVIANLCSTPVNLKGCST